GLARGRPRIRSTSGTGGGCTNDPRAHRPRGGGARARGRRGRRPRGRRPPRGGSHHPRRPLHERGAVTFDRVRESLLETSRTAARTADECAEQILGATAAIVESLRDGGKILLCGNGGSAGDAQHLATEFVSTLTVDRRRDAIAAIALRTEPAARAGGA